MEGEVVKSRFKRVCVFCGSSTGKRDCYRDAAIDLAQELVSRRLGLVYGGGSIGLMGLVSQAVHHGGGRVMGIIPRTLMNKEITGETVGEIRPVDNMHQRKAEMARHSDCFIALPGPIHSLFPFLFRNTIPHFFLTFLIIVPFLKKTTDNGFHFPFTALIFRWVWNYGRTVRSHHMGSTRHPRQTSWVAECGGLLQQPPHFHRPSSGGWFHKTITTQHHSVSTQRQGPDSETRGIRVCTRGSDGQSEMRN
uniref:Cytokinin riboside 5'-monophosphate phosphoribohydrolase n=1 Tax=Cucumis melo TaxID=3656 RepID=A0A1S4DX17_CUCME